MPDIFDGTTTQPVAEMNSQSKSGGLEANPLEATTEISKILRPVDEYSQVMQQEQASDNPFKAFLAKPEKVFFASQHYEEKVLLLLRQHPITQVKWIVISILLCFVPFLFQSVGLLSFLPASYQFASTVGWYLVILGYVLQSFLAWFYNVYIVTDERVVDVDFYSLLFKNISSAKIDKIEDITNQAGGVLAAAFDLGTIKVQTAGTEAEFEFENVPQPAKVAAFLNEMLVEEEKEKMEGRAN